MLRVLKVSTLPRLLTPSLAMAALSLLAFPVNGSEEWRTIQDGTGAIELPTCLISGPLQAIFDDWQDIGTISLSEEVSGSVMRYTFKTDLRPLGYLEKRHAGGFHTYKVDRKSLGVLSGVSDGQWNYLLLSM